MDTQQKTTTVQHDEQDYDHDACEICREVDVYMEAFETSVLQAINRLAKEQEWARGAEQLHESDWSTLGQENVQRLSRVLQGCISKMQALQAKIEAHTSET